MKAPQRPPTIGYLVWRLSMKWRVELDAAVAPLGLTHAKYSVLASLRGMTVSGGSPSQRELADQTGLDPIYISKIAKSLESAGLIKRVPDVNDSRAFCLNLTDEGIDVVDRAVSIVRDLLQELTEPIGGTKSKRSQALMNDLQILITAPPISAKRKESEL